MEQALVLVVLPLFRARSFFVLQEQLLFEAEKMKRVWQMPEESLEEKPADGAQGWSQGGMFLGVPMCHQGPAASHPVLCPNHRRAKSTEVS